MIAFLKRQVFWYQKDFLFEIEFFSDFGYSVKFCNRHVKSNHKPGDELSCNRLVSPKCEKADGVTQLVGYVFRLNNFHKFGLRKALKPPYESASLEPSFLVYEKVLF